VADPIRYLSPDEVLANADHYFERLGYARPILRGGGRALLESAVARAQTVAHYADGDLFDQAAALCNGLALNHPFVDGNKRTAFSACATFLEVNGALLPDEALVPFARWIIDMHNETDRTRVDQLLAAWLRDHAQSA
jgi:death on curing protein